MGKNGHSALDADDADAGAGAGAPEKKKGTRRRRRGKKNKGAGVAAPSAPNPSSNDDAEGREVDEKEEVGEKTQIVLGSPMMATSVSTSEGKSSGPLQLVVSEEVLGKSPSHLPTPTHS